MESKFKQSLMSWFSNRKRIIFYLKLVIALSLVYYLFIQYPNQRIEISFQKINYFFLTLALLLWFPNIFLQFIKWKIICGRLLNENNNMVILSSLFCGLSAALVTPFRIGEYAARNIPFKNRSVFDVTFATLVDNLCHLAVIFFVGAAFSILFIRDYYNPSVYLIFFLTASLILLLVCFFYVILRPQFLNVLVKKTAGKKFVGSLLDKREVLNKVHKDVLIKNVLLSLLLFVTYNLQFALLVIAFSGSYSLMSFFTASILVMFTKTLVPPVSFGELGIREGASIYFISNLGLSGIFGLYASLSLFLMNVLLPAIIGLFFLLRRD